MTYGDYKKVYVDKTLTLKDWEIGRVKQNLLNRENVTRENLTDSAKNVKIPIIDNGGFNIQLFANEKLPEGAYSNPKVRDQVQNKHIEGTKEHQNYAARLAEKGRKPSLLSPEIDVEAFVKNFHGKGIYAPGGDDSPREIVDAGKVIGRFWNNRTNSYEETTFVKIIYSKSGVHIFPVFPGSKE